MTSVTLTQIRKSVEAKGGEYKKENFRLNGNDAYTVNGVTMTKAHMVESYKIGAL